MGHFFGKLLGGLVQLILFLFGLFFFLLFPSYTFYFLIKEKTGLEIFNGMQLFIFTIVDFLRISFIASLGYHLPI